MLTNGPTAQAKRRSAALLSQTGITLAAVALSLTFQWRPELGGLDFGSEWLRDRVLLAQASEVPEQRFVVVDIDEHSLTQIGPWPWPRERLADLLENLLGPYEARGVGLDLVLPERADAAGDTRLAMLSQHGPLVLAQAFDYDLVRPVPLRIGRIAGGQPAADGAIPAPMAGGYIGNHEGLGAAARGGNIGFVPDKDGMIRRLPLHTRFQGRDYPTLSLALFACCAAGQQGGPASVSNPPSAQSAQSTQSAMPSLSVPSPLHSLSLSGATDRGGFWRVPYRLDWSAYMVVPAAEILRMGLPRDAVAGRLVLLGSSSLGLSDRVATPLSPNTSGLLVHAAALTALLDRQAGQAPQPWPGQWVASAFSIFAALLLAFTCRRLSALANAALLVTLSLLWLGAVYLMAPHDPHFSATGPLLVNLFLLAVAVPFAWQMSQRQSRQLLGTLRQYVAEAVVDELLRRDLQDPLLPSRLEVTTLIADVEGYTGHVEALPVEQAAQLTRDFLECMTRPVLAMHGTLDKYTGDGLVAFWGAPLPIEDHADLALDAALGIAAEVARLNRLRGLTGHPAVRVRVGIESGIAMAGDFGTSARSIYTAVGDSVNVASRLQDLARGYPQDIIVGQGTADRAKRHSLQLLGDIMLRGKEKPTTLYTIVGAPATGRAQPAPKAAA